MVQRKDVRVGLALVAALVGMGVSGTAAALPELQVDSRMVQDDSTVDAQVQSVDATDADESDSVDAGDDAQPASD